jgi:hypothetical protein
MNDWYDEDDMTEEEMEEEDEEALRDLEAFLEANGTNREEFLWACSAGDRPNILQLLRLKGLEKKLKQVFWYAGAQVTHDIGAPRVSYGYVRVEDKPVLVWDPALLLEATKFTGNVDICPLVNGKVQVDFTFSDTTLHTKGFSEEG